MTGYTVVTRESEWDDNTRGRAMRLDEYERGLCSCCGLPADVAHDDKQAFLVDYLNCRAGAARSRIEREHGERPENKDNPGWRDGRRYYVVPIDTPDPERT